MATDNLIKVSEQENLITLIHAARDDPKFRQDILKILHLEPFQRKSMLGSYLAAMQLQNAPPSFVQAIALLRDAHVADKARDLIEAVD